MSMIRNQAFTGQGAAQGIGGGMPAVQAGQMQQPDQPQLGCGSGLNSGSNGASLCGGGVNPNGQTATSGNPTPVGQQPQVRQGGLVNSLGGSGTMPTAGGTPGGGDLSGCCGGSPSGVSGGSPGGDPNQGFIDGPTLTSMPQRLDSASKVGTPTTPATPGLPTTFTPGGFDQQQPGYNASPVQTRSTAPVNPWTAPGGGFQDPAAGGGHPMPGWSPTGGGGAVSAPQTRPISPGVAGGQDPHASGNPLTPSGPNAAGGPSPQEYQQFMSSGGPGGPQASAMLAKFGGDQNAMNNWINTSQQGLGGQMVQHAGDTRPWIVQRLAQIQAQQAGRH